MLQSSHCVIYCYFIAISCVSFVHFVPIFGFLHVCFWLMLKEKISTHFRGRVARSPGLLLLGAPPPENYPFLPPRSWKYLWCASVTQKLPGSDVGNLETSDINAQSWVLPKSQCHHLMFLHHFWVTSAHHITPPHSWKAPSHSPSVHHFNLATLFSRVPRLYLPKIMNRFFLCVQSRKRLLCMVSS